MFVEVRFAVSRTRGVCGREGFSSTSWCSSSARGSSSAASALFFAADEDAFGLVVFLTAASSPMPSKSSSSWSSVALTLERLPAMIAVVLSGKVGCRLCKMSRQQVPYPDTGLGYLLKALSLCKRKW